ncbi:NACHT, LRR and PYD domains-containing protein 12-like [Calonectris borealis]|uniref:NACHT, LRR and PYD domains-containing protein 12-like n=1 Tax=Calonectris borealis TaxID=1323832 RepID=UPI003F4BAC88
MRCWQGSAGGTAAQLGQEEEEVSAPSLGTGVVLMFLIGLDYRQKYRDYVAREFCTFKEVNTRLGENVTLSSRYAKLMMVTKTHNTTEQEHEVLRLRQRHEEVRGEGAKRTITVETLFQPDKKGQIPQIIVLVGAAGIGKTMTSRKIMLDWAKGALYAQFDYAFYISCREINLSQQEDLLSLGDLMSDCCPDRWAPLDEILASPQKLLFIIDGFDELRFSLDQPKCKLCSSAEEKKPVEIILSSLLEKTLLSESSLLITTRPTALQSLGQCLKTECFAEILGFSEAEREEYFRKFFMDEDKARKAISFVKRNDTLFTMCLVPIICWTVCTALEQELDEGNDLSQPSTTITELYVSYLSTLLKCGKEDLKQDLKKFLGRLCCLAADGIWRQEILFEEKEIKEHGLNHQVLCSLFLSESVLRKGRECVNVYSFVHLSFQEFFAALFYALGDSEDTRGHSETPEKRINVVLENYNECKTRFILVVRFLFGLLNNELKKKLKEITGCETSPQIEEDLLRWTQISQGVASSSDKVVFDLNIFHCLFESHEETFVSNALEHFTGIVLRDISLTQFDQRVLSFCVKPWKGLDSLHLEWCFLTWEDHENKVIPGPPERSCLQPCQTEQSQSSSLCLLHQAVGNPRSKLKTLSLWQCQLTSRGCRDLAAALSTSQSLRELDVQDRQVGDAGVRLLCEGLKHPACLLERLRLGACELTSAGCEDLGAVLSTNQRLRDLDIGDNKLGDAGVRLLCEGLKHPTCRLEKLRLWWCRLTSAGCGDLATALSTNQSLRELDVGSNDLGDAGVRLLCEGLKHPTCRLENVGLRYCQLTSTGCGDLATALGISLSLRELDLGDNDFGDAGVQLLFEGLKQPTCRLEILGLQHCQITSTGCGDLATLLSTSPSLRELDLGDNDVGDAGVRLLCEGLKHPSCRLEKLRLWWSKLTSACCGDLAAVLSTNQSLRELHLGGNNLGDAGMRLLCEGLKHPACRLEKLRLQCCQITSASCGDLADALGTNQSLQQLDISTKDLGDPGVRLLCKGLKNSTWQLESIRLIRSVLNEGTQQELAP